MTQTRKPELAGAPKIVARRRLANHDGGVAGGYLAEIKSMM